MTICPFMSGSVVLPGAPNHFGPIAMDRFVDCQREECAAWGAVGFPDAYSVACEPIYGCRLIGGPVRE